MLLFFTSVLEISRIPGSTTASLQENTLTASPDFLFLVWKLSMCWNELVKLMAILRRQYIQVGLAAWSYPQRTLQSALRQSDHPFLSAPPFLIRTQSHHQLIIHNYAHAHVYAYDLSSSSCAFLQCLSVPNLSNMIHQFTHRDTKIGCRLVVPFDSLFWHKFTSIVLLRFFRYMSFAKFPV